jgi:hypothetical protein
MALELAKHNAVYEDIASKFFEVRIGLSQVFHIPLIVSVALHFHRGRHDIP